MKTVTLKNGKTYIDEGDDDNCKLTPANVWIENQVAVSEIATAFQLLYEQRYSPRFDLFFHWLLGKLEEKYGQRWSQLFEAYLQSPDVQSLILESEVTDFLKNQNND
jgi:hypothetical protein